MDLLTAKQNFLGLVKEIKPDDISDFLTWIKESDQFSFQESGDIVLENIASDIRGMVPFDALMKSEETYVPISGKNADCDKETTLHVDNFLYTDEYLDTLVDEEKFSRNYCKDCNSKNTVPLTFISHSMSTSDLKLIYKRILKSNETHNKIIIDIGSRLGPVLYAAHLFTSASKIIGIELNTELCSLQRNIVEKYALDDRIQIINENMLNCVDVLSKGDVIFMNNVFEFFTKPEDLKKMWKFVISSISKPGQIIVACPSLEESVDELGFSSKLNDWVEEVTLDLEDENRLIDDVHVYTVK